jgi:hypothetical protein
MNVIQNACIEKKDKINKQIWAPAHQGIGWQNKFLGIDSWAP